MSSVITRHVCTLGPENFSDLIAMCEAAFSPWLYLPCMIWVWIFRLAW